MSATNNLILLHIELPLTRWYLDEKAEARFCNIIASLDPDPGRNYVNVNDVANNLCSFIYGEQGGSVKNEKVQQKQQYPLAELRHSKTATESM